MTALVRKRSAVSLRQWTARDDTFVAELSREAFGEYAAHPARYVLRTTHRAGTHSWVAEEAGVPVGIVTVELVAGEALVLAIAVARPARGRGVGNLLMQAAEGYAAGRGAVRVALFTGDANLGALDLFLRRGFRIVARRRHFYAGRQDACRLEKALPRGGAR